MTPERYDDSPVSRPFHIGEFTESASNVGRCRNRRSQSWTALSPEFTPTCTCRPKTTSRRVMSRIACVSHVYRSPGLYCCSDQGLKGWVPPQTSVSPSSSATL